MNVARSGLRLGKDGSTVGFRGREMRLVTATEHYGSLVNRAFDFEPYFDQLAREGLHLTRLFALFRELQSAVNPYSTCKPDSLDFLSPYPRTGPGLAADGIGRYDLSRWNDQYFERLHRILRCASDHDVIVEFTLLSNVYQPQVWELHPLCAANNIQGVGRGPWYEFLSERDPLLFEAQAAVVRRLTEEVAAYDNVIIEICNEPGGSYVDPSTGTAGPTPEEVNRWQRRLLEVIRDADQAGSGHLVAGAAAFSYQPWRHPVAEGSELGVDVVNVHPLDVIALGDRDYDLGRFMSGQLRVRNVRDFCLAARASGGAVNLDEDNAASRYLSEMGWTIHRKRAWTALLCGCHYDLIDFSIVPGFSRGSPGARRGVRRWFGLLNRFVEENGLASSRPAPELVRAEPEGSCVTAARVGGGNGSTTAVFYVATEAEVDLVEGYRPAVGEGRLELSGSLAGAEICFFAPATGRYFGWRRGGHGPVITLPRFVEDIVVVVTGSGL